MVTPKVSTQELLERAAELRATGASWESIAMAVGRTTETVRRWPRVYRVVWNRRLATAERQIIAQATAEAVAALRQQIRSQDEKIARDAAHKLVQMRMMFERTKRQRQQPKRKPARRTNTDGQRIAHHLRTLTDAQIDSLLDELNGAASSSGDADNGARDSPSTT